MSSNEQTTTPLPRDVQWALGWLAILCSIFVVNAVVALFGLHVVAVTLPVCVVLALSVLYQSSKHTGRAMPIKRLVALGVAFMIATVALGYVVALIWEYSMWGRGFYTDAVVALADGWNPVYQGMGRLPEIVYRSGKAVWYLDASFYAFLGHYEMAKLHTVMFAIPTFLLARHCFARLLGGHERLATLAGVLLLLNPVTLSQMFTYYDDAVLAFVVVCFLMLGYLCLNEGYLHNDVLTVMALLWTFMLHMQMGGWRAALILGMAFIAFVAIFYKKQALKWLVIRAVLVVFVAFVIVGFNPLIQNWVDTGNPICLAFGDRAVNLTSAYMPWVLEGKSQPAQFFYSMMASPDTEMVQWNILLQQLTAFVNSAYAAADVRLRGFGFIGGLLLVAAVVLFVLAIVAPKRDVIDEDGIYFDEEEAAGEDYENYLSPRVALVWMAVPIMLLVIFSPTPWWARTVPMFWAMIPLAVVALCVRRGNGKSAVAKLLLVTAFLNCGLMAFSTLSYAASYTTDVKGHWERMNAEGLPSEADARQHNEYMKNFKTWNTLKSKGEKERIEHGIWTKVEGIVK